MPEDTTARTIAGYVSLSAPLMEQAQRTRETFERFNQDFMTALDNRNVGVTRGPEPAAVIVDEPDWDGLDEDCQCDMCTEQCEDCGLRIGDCICDPEDPDEPQGDGRLTITDTAEDIERWVKSLA